MSTGAASSGHICFESGHIFSEKMVVTNRHRENLPSWPLPQVGHCQVAQPFVSDSAKPAHVEAPASSTDSSFESEVLRRLMQILICHLAMACARHARHRDHGTVRRRNPIWSLISSDPSPPVARARIAVMYRRQRNRSGASVNNQKRCSWERNLGPAEGHSASVSSGCSTVCIVGH